MKLPHIFHTWSPWVKYNISVERMFCGRIYPQAIRGQWHAYQERRQKRQCTTCSKIQDQLVKES